MPPRRSREAPDPLQVLLDEVMESTRCMVFDFLVRERSPGNFVAVMTRALASANLLRERLRALHPPANPLACKEGCSLCCSRTIVVTQPPFAIFALYYARNTEPGAAYAHAAGRLQEGGTDCPFLADGSCSVYPARPLVCRLYHSFDLGRCRRRDYQRSPTLETLGEVAVAKGLLDGFRELGLDCRDVAFDKALKLLLSRPRTAEQWLAGAEVFASCRLEPAAGKGKQPGGDLTPAKRTPVYST